jgi:hypothetical protein
VYVEPPTDMGLKCNQVLLGMKPLYGIPEAGLHWFYTYSAHHKEKLRMGATKGDRCLLYRRDENKEASIAVLQVDDSLGFCTELFLDEEETESKQFRVKPRLLIRYGYSALLNGHTIYKKGRDLFLSQRDKIIKLNIPQTDQDWLRLAQLSSTL